MIIPGIKQLPKALNQAFNALSRFEQLSETDQTSLLALAMGMVKIDYIIKDRINEAELAFDAWRDLPPEEKDLALAVSYQNILEAEEIVDGVKLGIEAQLVFRAEEKRADFKEPFAPKEQQSRSITLKGEGFSVSVTNQSTWEVQKDVSERAKQLLSRYAIKLDDQSVDECGMEAVNRMELAVFVKDIAGGQLTEAKAKKFINFRLPESTPKEIIDIQKEVRNTLLPSASKVKYNLKLDKKK